MDERALDDEDYRELLMLRDELRRFLRWSEQQAKAVGLTDAQHQLLLAIRGHEDPSGPSISDIADHLLLKHHSAVELVQRAELAGLVDRRTDSVDRRLVRLALSASGAAALIQLAPLHVEETRRLSAEPRSISVGLARRDGVLGHELPDDELHATADGLRPVRGRDTPRARGARTGAGVGAGSEGAPEAVAAASEANVPAEHAARTFEVRVRRVYDRPSADGGRRLLVDRLWPRGVRADDAPFDEWLSSVAPSSELRRSYGRDDSRFDDFARRYRAELAELHADELDRLVKLADGGPVTLVTASDDVERSAAAVLADELHSRTRA